MHKLRYTGALDEQGFNQLVNSHPWWYHSFYFDNGFSVRGDFNIGADVHDYGFPEDMKGMNVLDIGSGGGWFSIYFAQQGANVTAVDLRGHSDFDMFGRYAYAPIELEKPQPDRFDETGAPIYDSPVSKTFWMMRDLLGLPIKFKNSRVYNISPALFGGQTFDLVFMGALLLHLRDPIGALMAARSVCHGTMIASTPVHYTEPMPEFPPRQYLPHTDVDKVTWWQPNEAAFYKWFEGAGFGDIDISKSVTLRGDLPRLMEGRQVNGDQIHRVGRARAI